MRSPDSLANILITMNIAIMFSDKEKLMTKSDIFLRKQIIQSKRKYLNHQIV